MITFLKSFLDIILPPRCPCCGKIIRTQTGVCPNCFNKINFISAPYCKICGMPFENQSDVTANRICPACLKEKRITHFNRSAVLYEGLSKKLLLHFKFYDKPQYAKLFAKWLKVAGADIFKEGTDLIVPVPLSYRRLIKRRYNQSALLAGELSKITGLEVDMDNLKKIKHTKPQSELLGKARLKNIKKAFALQNPTKIKGKKVLLVDDIMTTGATLAECANILLKAGAIQVDTLTVARVKKE